MTAIAFASVINHYHRRHPVHINFLNLNHFRHLLIIRKYLFDECLYFKTERHLTAKGLASHMN